MNSAYVYLQIYRLFDEVTPLKVDCGELCGSACCGGGDDMGMFLFPGESSVYKLLKPEGMRVEYSDFSYEDEGKIRRVPILFCNGECDRYVRPLACRIFPLTPVLDGNGKVKIKPDPRAKSVCPLAKTFRMDDYKSYNDAFVRAVTRAFSLLSKNKRVMAFMGAYTEYINDFERFV